MTISLDTSRRYSTSRLCTTGCKRALSPLGGPAAILQRSYGLLHAVADAVLRRMRSQCHRMRLVADRLSVRWYLGYTLPESLPNQYEGCDGEFTSSLYIQ
jgi:hypothetical protein